MLAGRELVRRVDGKTLLRGVTLEVQPGSCLGLLGHNGAGKSVALRALSLLEPCDTGEVEIDGEVYRSPLAGRKPPWPCVTMVFQQLFLWPHLTIGENLKLAAQAVGERDFGEVDRWAQRLQLTGLMGRRPNQCSLGERQKAALLRAVVQRRRVRYLLLDEVTSALDVQAIQTVIEILRELKREGVGLVLVSHQLGFLAKLADRVAFMDDGAVVEVGERGTLRGPQTERFAKFLDLMELL